ncbi:MAG TPA: pyrroline-5-carboxylate reductase [Terriglobales bacterium]|nr:pyrroline-5-carboxylate reductase [Terriglobales bacterium]
MKLGFVGTGAITSAIVTGLSSASADQSAIQLSPRNHKIASELATRFPHVSVASSNQDVLDNSDVVILAVRPQIAANVVSELRFRPDHQVISLISAISLASISELVAPATKVARAVPLPSVADRLGPTAIYPPDPLVADLFGRLGTAIEVETANEFDGLSAATATIASYFAFADAIVSWLTRHGVSAPKARDYVARIFRGSINAAVDAPERSLKSLADEHATRGGINEQVLSYLVERGVFEDLSRALDAVLQRITSASKKF